jgi:hypothetical protein
MSIDENAIVQGLLERYMRAAERRDVAKELAERANQWVADERKQIGNLQAAFSAFGFDFKEENVWQRVREQIGRAAYSAAISEGKASARSSHWDVEVKTFAETTFLIEVKASKVEPALPVREAAEADVSDTTDTVETSETDAPTSQATSAITNTVISQDLADKASASDEGPPKVRDTVLEKLKLAGDKGLKAADVRKYYEDTFSTELHEKTIGMTLYRLSKESLARREGRTWYYVAPGGDAQNQVGEPEFLK